MTIAALPQAIEHFLKFYLTRYPSAKVETNQLKVLVGVSGGPDSVALLHALCALKPYLFPLEVQVAHLNHLIRGESSEEDANYVKQLCQQFQVICHSAEYDVPAFAGANHFSLEDAARRVRFAFFASLMARLEIPLLLLAHTADDQAETVLLRLLRGTGPHGLAGIAPLAPLPPPDPRLNPPFQFEMAYLQKARVGRPFLENWRNQIEDYCTTHRLNPRRDETNVDVRYTRNRIRLELLPQLEKNYKATVKANLTHVAALMRDEQEWLDQLTENSFAKYARLTATKIEFQTAYLKEQPVALQRRLLRRAYRALTGSLENLDAADLEPLLERANTEINLPGGWIGFTNSQTTGLRKTDLVLDVQAFNLELVVPGMLEGEQGWRIETRIVPYEAVAPEKIKTAPKNTAYLDYEACGQRLLVRSRLPGEKFRPLGAPGRRKVQDLMLDAKIAKELRSQWPLVVRPGEGEAPEQIIWLPGVAIAEEFKVKKYTKSLLILNFFWEKEENPF
jgi:tRNA(Ile)-lysidine synthase